MLVDLLVDDLHALFDHYSGCSTLRLEERVRDLVRSYADRDPCCACPTVELRQDPLRVHLFFPVGRPFVVTAGVPGSTRHP